MYTESEYVLFIRTSPITGERNEMKLPVTALQYAAWTNGALIQDAFPHLDANEREFIINGVYPGDLPEEEF